MWGGSENLAAVKKALRKGQCMKGNDAGFFQALESCIWATLERGQNISSLLPVLVYEGSSGKKPEDDRGSISVFLDCRTGRSSLWQTKKLLGGSTRRLLQAHASIRD